MCLGLAELIKQNAPIDLLRNHFQATADSLATSRPTAVNLFWALDRMRRVAQEPCRTSSDFAKRLLAEARAIHDEDEQMCDAIGRHGAPLLQHCRGVLTHCNAGALATGGIGTALAAIYTAVAQGQHLHVYADETRPLLQGARLTAWELSQSGIPVTVQCDNMAATLMRRGDVQAVIVGADRITARGDVANKIGTYGLAIMASYHRIPFYVAAPSSTFDFELLSGEEIPIEERARDEIAMSHGTTSVPAAADVYNPAFDYTPAELITAIITERGVISPVTESAIRNRLPQSQLQGVRS